MLSVDRNPTRVAGTLRFTSALAGTVVSSRRTNGVRGKRSIVSELHVNKPSLRFTGHLQCYALVY